MSDADRTTTTAGFLGISDDKWAAALQAEGERIAAARLTCKHTEYQGMTIHGRCCPNCGTFMVDLGD